MCCAGDFHKEELDVWKKASLALDLAGLDRRLGLRGLLAGSGLTGHAGVGVAAYLLNLSTKRWTSMQVL